MSQSKTNNVDNDDCVCMGDDSNPDCIFCPLGDLNPSILKPCGHRICFRCSENKDMDIPMIHYCVCGKLIWYIEEGSVS